MRKLILGSLIFFVLTASGLTATEDRRKVIIDQDCSGPGGSNMQTLLTLIQSPAVEVLGITVVSDRWWHEHDVVPKLLEGEPHTKPADEDAAHFLIRMVRKYPHEVTIYEGGPMTNLALASAIDPHFAEFAESLVFMGGSLDPETDDPEFLSAPRHEFNFWFDPEAAKSVLEAPWKKIVCTPVDISVKTRITGAMVAEIETSTSAAAHYVVTYFMKDQGGSYMWDELAAAAWIDPTLITKKVVRYMSVDLDHGAAYGNTLTWTDQDDPKLGAHLVEIQMELDLARFNKMFVDLMKAPTPQAP